jgi:hypothetical protein
LFRHGKDLREKFVAKFVANDSAPPSEITQQKEGGEEAFGIGLDVDNRAFPTGLHHVRPPDWIARRVLDWFDGIKVGHFGWRLFHGRKIRIRWPRLGRLFGT